MKQKKIKKRLFCVSDYLQAGGHYHHLSTEHSCIKLKFHGTDTDIDTDFRDAPIV